MAETINFDDYTVAIDARRKQMYWASYKNGVRVLGPSVDKPEDIATYVTNVYPDIEKLAKEVDDNGGCYFVPAFSGLYAPYWKSDARGVIVGLTRYVNKSHIARAALEATAFQTWEVLEAMEKDAGIPITSLRVDGGMVVNQLLMQFQADILGAEVICPKIIETTALGAAYAAGLAVGYWENLDDLRKNWGIAHTWKKQMPTEKRQHLQGQWKKAVTKSFDWAED
jgi:glycerol kinase